MSTPSTKAAAKPKRPTKAELQERATLKQQIETEGKALRAKRSKLKAIETKIAEYGESHDPENRGWRFCGFQFRFTLKRNSISWKDAFVERCGPEAVAEVESKAGENRVLVVERVG